MKRNYDECVTKYSDSFVRVVLDPGYVSRIQNFVTELVEAKSKEDHHKIDSNKEVKRFTTGFLGEAALEKLFGICRFQSDHKTSCFRYTYIIKEKQEVLHHEKEFYRTRIHP